MKDINKQRMKYWGIALVIGILVLTLIGSLHLASASLGTFKQNECVSIRVLANCSSVNLTEISNGNNVYKINSAMELLGGQTFNYTFCNTSEIGTYTYSWNNPCVDCSDEDCGNSFIVSSDGLVNSYIFQLILIVIILALFVLAFNKQDPTILAFANLAMYVLSIWLLIYGFSGYKDNLVEGIAIVLLGFSFYVSYKVYEEYTR